MLAGAPVGNALRCARDQRPDRRVDPTQPGALGCRNRAFDEVGSSDELRDLARNGSVVNLSRRADLGDASVEHHHNPVRHDDRLGLVVGHVDGRDSHAPLQSANEVPHVAAQPRVEVRQRLVEEQHRWLDHQRARERHALLLAAGQLARVPLLHPGELNHLQDGRDAALRIGGPHLAHLQPEGEVLPNRQVGEQGVGLEHHAHVAPFRREPGHVPCVEQDPPLVRILEPGHAAQRRRLAAAARTEKRDELALSDIQVEVAENLDRSEVLDEALNADLGHEGVRSAEVGRDRPTETAGTGGSPAGAGRPRRASSVPDHTISRFQRSATSGILGV